MYICLCKGITDRQIKTAICEGAASVGQLRKTLGVASQCGKCSLATREILQQMRQNANDQPDNGQYYALA